jgi:predicted amidohydrolase YtcJ
MDETYQRAYRKYLRPEQFQRQIPLRKIVDMGGILIGGSDSPVQDYNPFIQIHGMVNFPLIHERLTVYQAFRTYTINGAYATFEEGTRGTLIPGKHADFILLNANPFTIDSEKILDLTVHATYIRGAEIHPFDRSSKQVIVHGLFGSGNPL